MKALDGLPLSRKQIDYVVTSDAFVNLAEGSIRAGKTISGALRWLGFVATAPTSGDLVVCSKTYDTATRNIFTPLRDPTLFGPLAKATSYTRGAPTATILGRPCEVITFNDERSESRLRGMTAAGGYVDEWSLMPESFHEQLLGRCSLEGAQLFGNTNPDNPMHWLKTKYIDESGPGGRVHGDWKVWKFLLDDNPGLSEKVKERYRRQYTGLWYRRMIRGEWVMAEGAIYEMWDESRHVVKELPTIVRWIALGMDYGTTNPFHALLLGLGADGCLYITHEWRWDSRAKQRSLTDAEYSAEIHKWVDGLGIQPEWTVIDPSAASFRVQMYRDGWTSRLANNDVVDGIRQVASLLSLGRLRIHERCSELIREIPGYTWDPKAAEKGDDKPIKVNDHGVDALRYAIHTTESIWRPALALAA